MHLVQVSGNEDVVIRESIGTKRPTFTNTSSFGLPHIIASRTVYLH